MASLAPHAGLGYCVVGDLCNAACSILENTQGYSHLCSLVFGVHVINNLNSRYVTLAAVDTHM